MKNKLFIGVIGMVAMMFFIAGGAQGLKVEPEDIEQGLTVPKETVETKCDPCDYNLDYGEKLDLTEQEKMDEGYARFECDPCDYNLDYGEKH